MIKNGERTFMWAYENGRAVRNEIETGLSDGKWTEVTKRRVASSQQATAGGAPSWKPIRGSESVIVGNLSTLKDGQSVQAVPATSPTDVKSASPGSRATDSSTAPAGNQADRPGAAGNSEPGQSDKRSLEMAEVELRRQQVDLATESVKVAEADIQPAESVLHEKNAMLARSQADVDRWDTEVKRLTPEVARSIIDRQVLVESRNQPNSTVAARDATKAAIQTAQGELLFKKAKLSRAQVAVKVARSALAVAERRSARAARQVSNRGGNDQQ